MKLLMEQWRKYLEESSSACSIYKRGLCDAYALALHKVFGYGMAVVRGWYPDDLGDEDEEAYEDCHLVGVKDDCTFVDVDGDKSEEDLKKDCFFHNPVTRITIEPVSEEEARHLFTIEGVTDEQIQDAIKFIKKQQVQECLKD